jgi:hypothetical protein
VFGFERGEGRYPIHLVKNDNGEVARTIDFPTYNIGGTPGNNGNWYGNAGATNLFPSSLNNHRLYAEDAQFNFDTSPHLISVGYTALLEGWQLDVERLAHWSSIVAFNMPQPQRIAGNVGLTMRGEAWSLVLLSRTAATLKSAHHYSGEAKRICDATVSFKWNRWLQNQNNLGIVCETDNYSPTNDSELDHALFQCYFVAYSFPHIARLKVLSPLQQQSLEALTAQALTIAPEWLDVAGGRATAYKVTWGIGSDTYPPSQWLPNWLAVYNKADAKQGSGVGLTRLPPYNREDFRTLLYATDQSFSDSMLPTSLMAESYLGLMYPALVEAKRAGHPKADSGLAYLQQKGLNMTGTQGRPRYFLKSNVIPSTAWNVQW